MTYDVTSAGSPSYQEGLSFFHIRESRTVFSISSANSAGQSCSRPSAVAEGRFSFPHLSASAFDLYLAGEGVSKDRLLHAFRVEERQALDLGRVRLGR